MARKSPLIPRRTQTHILTLLICLTITGAAIMSLDHAGIIDLNPIEPSPGQNLTAKYTIVNATDHDFIQVVKSNLMVQFTCTAPGITEIHWDFGDGMGSDEGAIVLHEYASEGKYLVEATIVFNGGQHSIEYYNLDLDSDVMADIGGPGFHIWTIYTYSLLLSGILSLVWFMVTFYHRQKNGVHIWPRAFTPELRLFLGFGLIFCFFIAIGWFNGIIIDIISVFA